MHELRHVLATCDDGCCNGHYSARLLPVVLPSIPLWIVWVIRWFILMMVVACLLIALLPATLPPYLLSAACRLPTRCPPAGVRGAQLTWTLAICTLTSLFQYWRNSIHFVTFVLRLTVSLCWYLEKFDPVALLVLASCVLVETWSYCTRGLLNYL